MGDHSDKVNPKKNGKPPYTITSAAQFEREFNTLMGRLQGPLEMWYIVLATLARGQHNVQVTMDGIQEAMKDQEGDPQQPADGEPEKAEAGKAKRTGPEYPH